MSMGNIDLGPIGIWTGMLDQVPSSRAAELAAEVEELGYGAIWIPEAVGRDPFVMATLLLAGTSSVKVATGIANIYARDAMTMANAQRTVAEAFEGRFLLGLGVSHHTLVEGLRQHDYSRPFSYMRQYLERMRKAVYFAHGPQELPEMVLAALGPRMLQLSATATAGAHPYFVPPNTPRRPGRSWGPPPRCTPSRWSSSTPILTRPTNWHARTWPSTWGYPTTPTTSCATAFEQADIDGGPGGGPSNRLVDAIVAWGTPTQITARVREHLDAGADHVGIQVLADDPEATAEGWRILAPALLA